MKRILIICLLSFSVLVNGQENEPLYETFPLPKVDKRVELLSIVFRLAGNPEYNDKVFSSYVNDIHAHFDQYKDHELISLAQELRSDYGISFDAVMSLAIHIEQPPTLNPLFEFSSSIDKRWNTETANEFIKQLKKFYIDADCETFFKEHEKLYSTSEKRFEIVYKSIDIEWYNTFYGLKPNGRLITIMGLGNGGCNYGPKVVYPNGTEESYAILETNNIDSINYPVYNTEDLLPTYIHEFNHSYINDLTKRYETRLSSTGEKLFDVVEWSMKRQAYSNWQTMINESLVRASVIRYLIVHNNKSVIVEDQLKKEFGRGFFWIKKLVVALGEYEQKREEYPTFDSYMPKLIECFEQILHETNSMFKI